MIAVPIVAATASAWWFQYDAMRAAGLAVLLAGTVATSLESLGLAFAGLAHKARALHDSALLYRLGMWAVVTVAAAVNYRHGSPAWSQPGLTGVVFASLSVGSVAGWELRERQAYRQRIADRLPARRPRFGFARWLRYPLRTWHALSLAIRDGHTDPAATLAAAATERQHRRFLRDARRVFNRAALKQVTRRLTTAEHTRVRPPAPVSDKEIMDGYADTRAQTQEPTQADARWRHRRRWRQQRGSSGLIPPPTTATPQSPITDTTAGDRPSTDSARPATAADQPGSATGRNRASSSARPHRRPRARHLRAVSADHGSVDIGDLLPIAHEVAAELGPRLSRDRLLDGIRQRGHSIGGRRRDAVYQAVRPARQATASP